MNTTTFVPVGIKLNYSKLRKRFIDETRAVFLSLWLSGIFYNGRVLFDEIEVLVERTFIAAFAFYVARSSIFFPWDIQDQAEQNYQPT